uniref:Uncharacterized protein n=1 Tax=Panagrolaimus superbus TaxID=310955 RepID=A0A914YPG8_9BILA
MNNAPSFFQSSFNANNITQQDLFSLINASYLNASLARSDSSSTLSTKTTHSAPSRSTLFKPSLSANPGSNLRTPQGRSQMPQSQRSRTVCPHWPKARCRCNK